MTTAAGLLAAPNRAVSAETPPALGPGGLAEQALELGHPQLHQSIEGHGSPPPFTAAASRRRLAWVISSISRVNSASPSPSRIR